MDPLTVVRVLWRHKWATIPVIAITLAACAYVYLFAPRVYEASMSYALAAPDVPSEYQLEQNKDLAKLNADNPYLRTGDSSLLSQVVISKLSAQEVVDGLDAAGLGTEFTIAPVQNLGMGLVQITASASTEEIAVKTAQELGNKFTSTVKSTQEVNNADSTYLYTAIPVRGPGPAQELYSSRLRSLIMVGIAGAILLFAVVSVAQSLSLRRTRGAVGEWTRDGEWAADSERERFDDRRDTGDRQERKRSARVPASDATGTLRLKRDNSTRKDSKELRMMRPVRKTASSGRSADE